MYIFCFSGFKDPECKVKLLQDIWLLNSIQACCAWKLPYYAIIIGGQINGYNSYKRDDKIKEFQVRIDFKTKYGYWFDNQITLLQVNRYTSRVLLLRLSIITSNVCQIISVVKTKTLVFPEKWYFKNTSFWFLIHVLSWNI